MDALFADMAFMLQITLVVHFAVRLCCFPVALRYGWIVYALGIPAAAAGVVLLIGGAAWYFWLAGFLYLAWGAFGFVVEYVRRLQWRNPIRWSVFLPYVLLYLAATMFYWWPLALIDEALWYWYGALFVVATTLNVMSHRRGARG